MHYISTSGVSFPLFSSCPGVHCCWCLYLGLGCKSWADETSFGLFCMVGGVRAQNVSNCSSSDLGYREGRRIPWSRTACRIVVLISTITFLIHWADRIIFSSFILVCSYSKCLGAWIVTTAWALVCWKMKGGNVK